MNEGSPTLLTSVDPPQCSIDSDDWGILVITGDSDGSSRSLVRPLIRSLGVRRRQQDTGTYTIVPLFPANQDPLSRTVQRIRGLEDRLTRLLSRKTLQQGPEDNSNSISSPPPLVLFLQECDSIFRELLSALQLRREPPKDTENEWVITSNYARQLVRELDNLQERYGASAIANVSEDCQRVTLHYQDTAGRVHVINLNLADPVPGVVNAVHAYFPQTQEQKRASLIVGQRKRPREKEDRWNLVEAYTEFCDTISSHQALYNELDDMDTNLVILEPDLPCPRNVALRRLQVTDEMSVVLTLSADNPRQCPDQMQWVGREAANWEARFNSSRWNVSRSVRENMECCLGASLPRRQAATAVLAPVAEQECAICYSDELINEGTGAAERPDVPCDNESCGRLYHSSCLREWLTSLPDSRVSFDCILGTCPYCKQPLSAAMQNH
jgi:E3 ubiquitin-protein ligase FANCL